MTFIRYPKTGTKSFVDKKFDLRQSGELKQNINHNLNNWKKLMHGAEV